MNTTISPTSWHNDIEMDIHMDPRLDKLTTEYNSLKNEITEMQKTLKEHHRELHELTCLKLLGLACGIVLWVIIYLKAFGILK